MHPHEYVDGANGRDLEIAARGGMYVSVGNKDPQKVPAGAKLRLRK